jgi:UDP-N-acetylglucosamine--N-acetylmuramyl-(pentapeptide) pyrophosphoryl-undecaprenol N-acetylglucosamine transferase
MFTGIPVRGTVNKTTTKPLFEKNDCFTVLIIGGSQGALVFNEWVPQLLECLKDKTDSIRFIHLAGRTDVSQIESVYDEYGFINRCFGFCHNMADVYAVTDFALCRAGAGTLTELALAAIPAVVIPYPYAADAHQLCNARLFMDAQAVELIEEKNATPEIVAQRIKYYLGDKAELKRMRTAMRKMAVPDAGKKITEIVKKIIDETR